MTTSDQSHRLKIYGVYRSRSSRVYWTAEELGIDFESIPVTLARTYPNVEAPDPTRTTLSPEFMAINPLGLVPVIDDGGLLLRESLSIAYYLARKSGGDLAPATLAEEAEVLSWMFWAATEMEPRAVELLVALEHSDAQPDRAAMDRMLSTISVQFKLLNDHLATRDYVVGGRFTIADLTIAEVFRLTQSQPALFETFSEVGEWIGRCQKRPSFARMMAGRKRELG